MRNFIASLLMLLSVIALYFYAYPTYQKIQVLQVQQEGYHDALDKLDELKAKTVALQQKINALPTADVDKVNEMISDSFESPRIMLDLEGIAKQNKIKITSVNESVSQSQQSRQNTTTASADAPTGISHSDITVTLDGEYKNFSGFLTDIESSNEIFDVIDASYLPSKDKKTVGGTYTLTLRTYSLK